MRALALAAALLATAASSLPAAAQPGVTARVERLPGGVERVGYRVPETDTTDTRTDVTLRLGDVSLRRRIVYPAPDDTAGAPVRAYTLARSGRTIGRWEGDFSGAWDRGFDLLRADLDGDGTRELLVVQHESEGNGLGVASWSVSVVPETGGDRPLVFSTADYGPSGLVVARPGGRRLMTASWEGGSEPRRGDGLYYTARFFRYDRGALVPDGPVLQRRYLNSFAALRGREMQAGRYRPERWIRTATRVAPSDPWSPPTARTASDAVTVVGTGAADDGWSGRFVLRVRDRDGREATVPVGAVGDAATGRFFPLDYVPLGRPADWLAGRTGRLDVHARMFEGDTPPAVLWLDR